jgi:hypothetical protein
MVLLVLVALVLFPSLVRRQAERIGITKIATPIGDLDFQALSDSTRTLARAVSASVQQVTEIREAIDSGLSPSSAGSAHIDSLRRKLDSTVDRLGRAQNTISSLLLLQQEATPAVTLPDSGWIYAGRLTERRNAWLHGRPEGIEPPALPIRPGALIVTRGNVYIRDSGRNAGERGNAPVLGVAPAGTSLRVVRPEYSHLLRGGWFVWLWVATPRSIFETGSLRGPLSEVVR